MKLKTVCNNDVIIIERIIITVLRLKRPKKKKNKEGKKRFNAESCGVNYRNNLKLKFTCGYKHWRSLSHRHNYSFNAFLLLSVLPHSAPV